MTPLDKPLRRELEIDGQPYTLTVDPDGLKLVEKGRRKGIALRWQDLVSGDAALATALQACCASTEPARPPHIGITPPWRYITPCALA